MQEYNYTPYALCISMRNLCTMMYITYALLSVLGAKLDDCMAYQIRLMGQLLSTPSHYESGWIKMPPKVICDGCEPLHIINKSGVQQAVKYYNFGM